MEDTLRKSPAPMFDEKGKRIKDWSSPYDRIFEDKIRRRPRYGSPLTTEELGGHRVKKIPIWRKYSQDDWYFNGYLPTRDMARAARLGTSPFKVFTWLHFTSWRTRRVSGLILPKHVQVESLGFTGGSTFGTAARKLVDTGLVRKRRREYEIVGKTHQWARTQPPGPLKVDKADRYFWGYIPGPEFVSAALKPNPTAIVFMWLHFVTRRVNAQHKKRGHTVPLDHHLTFYRHDYKAMGLSGKSVMRGLHHLVDLGMVAKLDAARGARPVFEIRGRFDAVMERREPPEK